MCLAADRKDGNGLQLENTRLVFSSFSFGSWKNHQKLTIVCPPFEKINRFPSLGVLGVFLVRNKVFNLNFSKLFTAKRKNPLDRVPQTLWFDYAHGVKQR